MAEENWKCHLRTALDLQASDQMNHLTKHLQSLKQMNNQKAEQGMVKSASTEILCQYNQQPIHVRSRAEQVRL